MSADGYDKWRAEFEIKEYGGFIPHEINKIADEMGRRVKAAMERRYPNFGQERLAEIFYAAREPIIAACCEAVRLERSGILLEHDRALAKCTPKNLGKLHGFGDPKKEAIT